MNLVPCARCQRRHSGDQTRHSREGGNPGFNDLFKGLDSRFRRDDEDAVHEATVFLGGQEIRIRRLEPFLPDEAMLSQYAGRYFSPELETFYSVRTRNGALVVSQRRLGELALTPTIRDQFAGGRWPVASISFARDETDAVTTMFVSSGPRATNMRFERVGAREGP